jgi:spore germination protein GerM
MKLSKTSIAIIIILFAAAATAAIFFTLKPQQEKPQRFSVEVPESRSLEKEAFIYFTNSDNSFLVPEKHLVMPGTNTRKYAQNLIKILINGPENNSLQSPLPQGTKLLSLYISSDNTAVLDFSEEIREKHPGGSQAEILTIYSIVNTLTLNIEEIDKVKILISGNEAETLAGHIALSFPLKENLKIVK